MTLTEWFVQDSVFVDFGEEMIYGSDQVYVDYPRQYPTVVIPLYATEGLVRIADRLRKDCGFKPLHPVDEFTNETCDNEGWYDFGIGISAYPKNGTDSALCFVVVNADSKDNEAVYSIDLSEEERGVLYARLNEQCLKYLGKGCDALLEEAREVYSFSSEAESCVESFSSRSCRI